MLATASSWQGRRHWMRAGLVGGALNKCFVNLKGATFEIVSVSHPYNSNHNVVHMILVYKTKLNSNKPEKKMIRTLKNY